MAILPQVAETMQTVLTDDADNAAIETGFIQRQRKLTGATFVQTLVFGWLANSDATLEELTQTAATLGVDITPQALDQRFTQTAAQCLEHLLDQSVCQVIAASPVAVPILLRFHGVYVQDSTTITLPSELAEVWKGTGRSTENSFPSGLKVQVRWEMASGALSHLMITDATTHDRSADEHSAPLPEGALRLADLGYFSLSQLKAFCDDGVLWLTRLQAMCVVFDSEGQRRDLAQWLAHQNSDLVALDVIVGVKAQLPCRLLAQRVSKEVAAKRRRLIRKQARRRGQTPSKTRLRLADWTVLITNVPPDKLNIEEAMVLARVRWR